MFSAASVCLFVRLCVCQHDNFRTSKHRMMKLWGRCIVEKSRPSSHLEPIAPGRTPPKIWGMTLEKSAQAVYLPYGTERKYVWRVNVKNATRKTR